MVDAPFNLSVVYFDFEFSFWTEMRILLVVKIMLLDDTRCHLQQTLLMAYATNSRSSDSAVVSALMCSVKVTLLPTWGDKSPSCWTSHDHPIFLDSESREMEWIWTLHGIIKPSNSETTYTEVLKMCGFFFLFCFLTCKPKSVRTFRYLAPQLRHPIATKKIFLFLCPPSFSASGSFPMSWLFKSGGQSIRASALASVLPMNIQGWFSLGWTGLISLMSKGLSKVFSRTTVRRHQFFGAQSFLLSSSHIHTWLLEIP